MKLNREHIFLLAGVGLAAAAVGLLLGLWLSDSRPQPAVEEPPDAAVATEATVETAESPLAETPVPPAMDEPETVTIDKAALEAIIADFALPDDGRLSLVVHDLTNQERLLTHNGGQLYPAASLYKLYLAYIAYEDVDSGQLTLEQPLVDHPIYRYELSLGACLHLMITVSDSPCGETLLAHYDYPVIQARLEHLDLPHVNAGAFQVSAEDMAHLLELIYGDNLSAGSRSRLLTAMRSQAYDVILQPAFRNYGRVYNKTGAWRDAPGEDYHWIDTGIVELGSREQALAISILHENVPTGDLLALAEDLVGVITAE